MVEVVVVVVAVVDVAAAVAAAGSGTLGGAGGADTAGEVCRGPARRRWTAVGTSPDLSGHLWAPRPFGGRVWELGLLPGARGPGGLGAAVSRTALWRRV